MAEIDPYIISNYQRMGAQQSNEDAQTLADLALKRTQNQAAQFQLGRQKTLADIFSQSAMGGGTLGGGGNLADPYSQAMARSQALMRGGFGQESIEAQSQAMALMSKIREITTSRLSAAQTPAQLDSVLGSMQPWLKDMYQAPPSDAKPEEKEAWRQSFIAGQLTPEQQAENRIKMAGNRELKENSATGQMLKFDKNTGEITPVGGGGIISSGLNQSAIDAAARRWNQEGELPPDINKADARAIQNRAAQLFPEANIAANKAAYRATASSLESYQKQADMMSATIKTFDKNVKAYEEAAAKVTSAGSPGLNKSWRWVQEHMQGDPNVARMNAARQTIIAEAAKINSGAQGGAPPLATLEEMEKNLPENATPKQSAAVIRAYMQDSKNRLDAMRETLDKQKDQLRRGGQTIAEQKREDVKAANQKHDAAAEWLMNPKNKSNPKYARTLETYKLHHGGNGPE